jgi:hypothetical protein
MRSSMLVLSAAVLTLPVIAQQSDNQDKPLDVRSSIGDLHVGKDADAARAGLPLYPGARPKIEKDNDPLNLGISTESFGFKLVVAKYESGDSPSRIIDFYRGKLKKYGRVLECHSHDDDVHTDNDFDDDKDGQHSKELKCDGDNTGPVTELKAGSEDNQRVVAIEPHDAGKTTFVVVHMHSRGKSDDI